MKLQESIRQATVQMVDVTFPGNARLEAVRKIAAAGKAVLMQKPLADNLQTAREIVKVCREAFTFAPGDTLELRYRAVSFAGKPDQVALDRHWESWAKN